MNSQELKSVVHRLGEIKSVLTEAELLSSGASMDQIEELVRSGVLYPSAQGIYMPENADFGERHTEVEVATRFPKAVICLNNALNFYNVTTQRAVKVWIAVEAGSPEPVEPKLPIKTVLMSEPGFSQGVEVYYLEGLPVKIYSLAKTIADCFVYEEEVGIDVAIEAFDQVIRQRRCTVGEILEYTKGREIDPYAKQDLKNCINRWSKVSA